MGLCLFAPTFESYLVHAGSARRIRVEVLVCGCNAVYQRKIHYLETELIPRA